jgi:hypothetical protein
LASNLPLKQVIEVRLLIPEREWRSRTPQICENRIVDVKGRWRPPPPECPGGVVGLRAGLKSRRSPFDPELGHTHEVGLVAGHRSYKPARWVQFPHLVRRRSTTD